MERIETPALWRKLSENRYPRSCGCRASALLCRNATSWTTCRKSIKRILEETLTVHRLNVPQQLRLTLASTNVIESAFAIVEKVCLNVKRWHGGDQRERWVGSGLLVAQKQFRRIKGYKQIPLFLTELQAFVSRNSHLAKGRKAS